jgi:uncharacterized membrane protein (GlpM family)
MPKTRKVQVEDLANFRLRGKARVTQAISILLGLSLVVPLFSLFALIAATKLGIERYDKDIYERVEFMRFTAFVYLTITLLAGLSMFMTTLPLFLLAKGWLVVRLWLLFAVYQKMPFKQSHISFARQAQQHMIRKGEEDMVYRYIQNQKY